jgi:beta-ribofuranosylaminobenzene 5'-phosphate synthase
MKTAPVPSPTVVTVRAAARLHLGFLDPSATLGRRFGSLGLVIDGHACEVELSLADRDTGSGTDSNSVVAHDPASAACVADLGRASAHLATLRQHSLCHQALHLRLRRVMPAHAGFGSGTQLALAVGRAFSEVHGLGWSTATVAECLGRGRRSGIGIAGFDQGGLLLDGGPGGAALAASAVGASPPMLAQIHTPQAWRVIVVEDPRAKGLSGDEERRAISGLPALPAAQAADICHQVLMRVLPGALCNDFSAFAQGINHMQDVLGSHFAAAQQGNAYTSAAVARLVMWLRGDAQAPRAAVGQSSWGPTGFAIVDSAGSARRLLEQAQQAGALDPALQVSTVTVRRQGAEVLHSRRAAHSADAAHAASLGVSTSPHPFNPAPHHAL